MDKKSENNTAKSFDKIARFYNNPFLQIYYKWAHRSSLKFLKGEIEPNFKILDVACGTGNFLAEIQKEDKSTKLFGIDISKNMISVAKKNYPNINFLIAEANNIPFENNFFDLITATDAFYYFPNKEKALKEFYNKLKFGHYLFIFYISNDRLPKFILWQHKLISKIFLFNTEKHSEFLTPKELTKLFLSTGFRIVKNEEKLMHRYILLQKNTCLKKLKKK